MKTKLATCFIISLVAAVANASSEDITGPVDLSCVGSLGSVTMTLHERVLDFVVNIDGKIAEGQVAPKQEGIFYSPGASAYLVVDAPSSGSSWLSLGASTAHKSWLPPHQSCRPRRAPGCDPVTVEGHFENSWDFNIDLMLDMPSAGHFTFNRLEFGGGKIDSLGSDTQCKVKFN